MRTLKRLIENNRKWVERINEADPNFFSELAHQQKPELLWIGCSDSRVPANQIVDLLPGELFVHRNVANLVLPSDLNCLSVIQFAVEVLQVKHIIVCGHYKCGGVEAALNETSCGLVENWISHIVNLKHRHSEFLEAVAQPAQRSRALCDLNVLEQVSNVCASTITRSAWQNGMELSIHGWIYDVSDGLLRDLGVCITNWQEKPQILEESLSTLRQAYLR
ncbi:MAG: carbonate dehydratase [Bdellovibrionales bacterium]|nr:carbonate dehydratase [Bdellovibrionales bacterium]